MQAECCPRKSSRATLSRAINARLSLSCSPIQRSDVCAASSRAALLSRNCVLPRALMQFEFRACSRTHSRVSFFNGSLWINSSFIFCFKFGVRQKKKRERVHAKIRARIYIYTFPGWNRNVSGSHSARRGCSSVYTALEYGIAISSSLARKSLIEAAKERKSDYALPSLSMYIYYNVMAAVLYTYIR